MGIVKLEPRVDLVVERVGSVMPAAHAANVMDDTDQTIPTGLTGELGHYAEVEGGRERDGGVDAVRDRVAAADVLEALQLDDEHVRESPQPDRLGGLLVVLALRAVPGVHLGQPLGLAEQLQAVLQRDRRRVFLLGPLLGGGVSRVPIDLDPVPVALKARQRPVRHQHRVPVDPRHTRVARDHAACAGRLGAQGTSLAIRNVIFEQERHLKG